MKNYVEPGDQIPVVAGADLASGAVVVMGVLVGVCEGAILNGATGTVSLKGVHRLPKATGALTQGARVYWDTTPGNVTTVAADGTFMGYAWKAAQSGDTYCEVLLGAPGVDTDT